MGTYCGKAVGTLIFLSALILQPSFAQDHMKEGQIVAVSATTTVSPSYAEMLDKAFDSSKFSVEYAVQVGAFTHQKYADKLKRKLAKAGYKVDVYDNYIDGKTLMHLVWVGTFRSESEAQATRLAISEQFKIDGVMRARTASSQR